MLLISFTRKPYTPMLHDIAQSTIQDGQQGGQCVYSFTGHTQYACLIVQYMLPEFHYYNMYPRSSRSSVTVDFDCHKSLHRDTTFLY